MQQLGGPAPRPARAAAALPRSVANGAAPTARCRLASSTYRAFMAVEGVGEVMASVARYSIVVPTHGCATLLPASALAPLAGNIFEERMLVARSDSKLPYMY